MIITRTARRDVAELLAWGLSCEGWFAHAHVVDGLWVVAVEVI